MNLRKLCVPLLLAAVVVLPACDRGDTAREVFAARLADADEIFRGREYEAAGEVYEKIAVEAEFAGATTAYVEACAMRARTHLITDRPEEGLPWLEKATAAADRTDPLAWSRLLGVRGRFEWQGEDSATATTTFREMFDYCEEQDLYERAVDAAHMMAITGGDDERFDWARKGIEMAEAGELTGWLGPLWNNLGWDYVDAGRYDDARVALERAREYHYLSEGELPKLIADYSVAHVMRLQGEIRDAKPAMEEVFRWAERLHKEGSEEAIEWKGLSRWELGEVAAVNGEKAVAVGLMTKALKELEGVGMPDWDPDGWAERQARIAELKQ